MVNTDFLKQFGIIPIDTATLTGSLNDYKSPKDKISTLEQSNFLIRLKRGLFVVSPKLFNQPLSRELIANHLYGPSYVSFQTALSYYKLIPERVHVISSMTIKRSRSFSTQLGNFEYIGISKEYLTIGIRQEIVNNEYAFLIASPEKALCDLIVQTAGLRLQSEKAIRIYLEEDMRIDLSVIERYNIDIIKECISVSKKKRELTLLYKLLKQ
ncbi:MAG: type IV toxin-antitoxin system AbiEi family antitoxin domain-containing protein [Paludibacter sp.]